MSAPGKRGLTLSPTSMIASTPRPIANVQGLAARSARDKKQGLLNKRTVIWFDAQHRGRLQNENMAGDAEEKAGRHRNGQKVSDEAELEDAGANENEPDCEAERRRGCRIMLRPRRCEHRKRAGENRRNGRIGAD